MILYIGNKLSNHGFTPTNVETLGLQLASYFDIVTISERRNKAFRMLDVIVSIIRYNKAIDKVLIDTYSTSNFYYTVIASFLCRILKLPYIPILHGGNLPERLDKSKILSKYVFKYSYLNISPSGYLKFEFEKRGYGPITLIPNNINIANYVYLKRVNIRPKLLWVRSFASLYNPSLAIEVVVELVKEYPNVSLCMVGQDKDGSMEKCKILAKNLHVENKIRFTGKLSKEEWKKLSEQYDIFINTTNVDNTPVSVIEAMALGLPVVSTNVGGIPYLLTNGNDAVLVDVRSKMQMVNAIKELITNAKKAQEISECARRRAESFDWEVIKHEWIKILS